MFCKCGGFAGGGLYKGEKGCGLTCGINGSTSCGCYVNVGDLGVGVV